MKNVDNIFILLILIITQKSRQMTLLPENSTSPVPELIVYILNAYFINSTKISFKYSHEQNSIVSAIAKEIHVPIFLNVHEYEPSELEEIDKRIPNDVSVIADEPLNLSKFLNESKWTATSQFFLIIGRSHASEEIMIDFFQRFWEKNILNVLLLVTDTSYVHVYTFTPFNQYDCAMHKPILLATWTSGQILTKEVIQKNRVDNLNGCTLNASVVNSPPSIIFSKERKKGANFVDGIEGLILKELSNRLNFKLNISEPADGGRYGWFKPTPRGAVGEVFLKKSHFACGNYAYKPDRYKYLDMTTSIGCDIECISWAVPVGAKKAQPTWISLFTSGFCNTVWFFIFVTLISATATFRILSKTSTIDQNLFNENTKTILYIFKSSLGTSVIVPKSLPLKIFFGTWLLYCFVIITAYQALMGSKLTVPQRHSNVDTFKDLLESNLLISGLRAMFRLVTDTQEEDEDIEAIVKRFKAYDYGFDKAIEVIIKEKNLAYMGTMTTFMYNVLTHPEAKGLIHYMNQCVRKYYPVILLQKNCPFTTRVDQIIRTLFESGIICKWRRQFLYRVPQLEPSVEKLSLSRMIGSFVILGAGLGAALIVFSAEYAFYWYSIRKDSRLHINKSYLEGSNYS